MSHNHYSDFSKNPLCILASNNNFRKTGGKRNEYNLITNCRACDKKVQSQCQDAQGATENHSRFNVGIKY